jgi:hypothetical protein
VALLVEQEVIAVGQDANAVVSNHVINHGVDAAMGMGHCSGGGVGCRRCCWTYCPIISNWSKDCIVEGYITLGGTVGDKHRECVFSTFLHEEVVGI